MERGLDQLGCVGVNMHISCFDRSVAETEFEPIYAELNRRGAILFVHPVDQRHLLAVYQRLQIHRARSAPRSRMRVLCCT